MDIMQKCIVHRQNGINNGENCKQETYTNVVPMSKEAFIRFMITQSNVIAQVEENGQSLEKAIKWFEESLEPVFHGTIQKRLDYRTGCGRWVEVIRCDSETRI